MNEANYTVVKVVAVLVAILVMSVSGCVMNRHYQIRVLAEKTNPLDAKCAIEGEINNSALCVLRAGK